MICQYCNHHTGEGFHCCAGMMESLPLAMHASAHEIVTVPPEVTKRVREVMEYAEAHHFAVAPMEVPENVVDLPSGVHAVFSIVDVPADHLDASMLSTYPNGKIVRHLEISVDDATGHHLPPVEVADPIAHDLFHFPETLEADVDIDDCVLVFEEVAGL